MDHDLTTATGAVAADGLPSGGPDTGGAAAGAAGAAAGTPAPSRPRGARGGIPGQAGAGVSGGASGGSSGGAASAAGAAAAGAVGAVGAAGGASGAAAGGGDDPGAGPGAHAGAADPAAPVGTVRLASPGSVVASIPFLFGFHPENSLVVLGVSHSAEGGSFIRHGVRIDLDQVRGHERSTALELAARLRDQNADIAILVAFGPRGATGAKARPDHCRKLMAAFRAQVEAAASEERVTVVDALYTANGRWWSYMCRNNRCCPSAGTVVPAEAPAALAGAFAARGHTVYASREALDATLDPYPPEVLARTSAAVEQLDPTWYDTDAGLADARRLMDVLLARCGTDSDEPAPRSARPEGPRAGRRGLSGSVTAALSTERPGSQSSDTDSRSADGSVDADADADASEQTASHVNGTAPHSADAVIPAARTSRRLTNRVPGAGASDGPVLAEPPGSLLAAPVLSDAEAAELLVALLNWRVRDYLACAAATVDSAGQLLRLGAELARRAPHPDLRLAPYALAAWAAWAIGRPAIAQCAVDRALAIDPEYKFASLIRAGLHHAIDGEGVRESAANTRREMFSEAAADPDAPGRDATGRDHADRDGTDPDSTDLDAAPAPIPSPRSTKKVRTKTETDLESP
ncbi:DUF4192 domain-containing protein [Catenulispora rubra]|uniref:DUF4192 domain-containing protein n=1 Tax=Catenulispora rubra TaxID=280293 RepID=UPI0018925860|nr:DUF4192 domain-containing protein [Catenulispora rubra]